MKNDSSRKSVGWISEERLRSLSRIQPGIELTVEVWLLKVKDK